MDRAQLEVGFATLLAGATPFNVGNVNETYRGQVKLADGSIAMAIVKDLSLRQLSNELLASTLARALGLPTPRVFIAAARPGVFELKHAPSLSDGSKLVFASLDAETPSFVFRYKEDPALAPSLLAALISWKGLGRCYGFDTWAANIDRHAGNLLFGGPKNVWLIDHGHAFTGPEWIMADLRPYDKYAHRLGVWLTPSILPVDRTVKASEAAGLEALLTDPNIDEIIQASRIDKLLPAEEIDALRNFLRDRRAFVAYYSNEALGISTLL